MQILIRLLSRFCAFLVLTLNCSPVHAAVTVGNMDVGQFALPLADGHGLMWEDPREVHKVIVHFAGPLPATNAVRLEYWGSRWPQQHLPKDREPGGGEVGWMELGNWYKYGWRTADAEITTEQETLTFTFRPVNAKEFPKIADYPARFRYTLKVRVRSEKPLPEVKSFQVFTDSNWADKTVRILFKNPAGEPRFSAFNGQVSDVKRLEEHAYACKLRTASNSDPNTFDRTILTVASGTNRFSVRVDDLASGPLFIPDLGAAATSGEDTRNFAELAAEQKTKQGQSLYDRIKGREEQSWRSAWEGVPRKRSQIHFPMGLDGGRQRFRQNSDGSIEFRTNDRYLERRPGKETPRLKLEPGPVKVDFGLPDKAVHRTLAEASLPICISNWEVEGVQVQQETFVTALEGTTQTGEAPAGDTFAVWLAKFTIHNPSAERRNFDLPISFPAKQDAPDLRIETGGLVMSGKFVRGLLASPSAPAVAARKVTYGWKLAPGETQEVIVKVPYVPLTEEREHAALQALDFGTERTAVGDYWRLKLDQSARLITPEPMLNEFYRSHARHLLVNCELEPGKDRRFARVGSFSYGAYGNESCMMVVDLERRGYHKEAQACLDAWLHYQGTAPLPGDFSTQEGVLYGAGGYESGGYNQHHGWILWMLAEHYRFTHDQQWLRGAANGILKAADWIIEETARTADRHELERGLLPAGSLEDIGDWWTWLSTSCYTWRGLDSAAWALEQISHPEAPRVRAAAKAYHAALIRNFHAAAERSPVVRLRDGTAVPHFPSYTHRRGRSFGWICETLEGALHLIITRAIDPHSREAGWILRDYEDNLYLSNQYGYTLDDFDAHWFGRGGMSMQACLLLDVEPYLYRDDVKHALRALFNGQAVSYFPDVRMNTEHALPHMEDWRGDHFKSSDEANCAGWLRYLFLREEGETLLVGQAIPREWLRDGAQCGLERGATHFGPGTVVYTGGSKQITARLEAPRRNPAQSIQLRFRHPREQIPSRVLVNGQPWTQVEGDWVHLPGSIGTAEITALY